MENLEFGAILVKLIFGWKFLEKITMENQSSRQNIYSRKVIIF